MLDLMVSIMETGKPTVKHYLREWRLARGLSQRQLSNKVGIAKNVISRYETEARGVSLQVMLELIDALDITPNQFFEPPARPSLDAIVRHEDEQTLTRLAKVVRAFIGKENGEG
jgi:transcriptional regulator with XRE-family HTH domain